MTTGLVLIGASLFTLLLRVLPVFLHRPSSEDPPAAASGDRPPRSLLDLLPLAVLSALIVPGAVTVDAGNLLVGTSGALTAIVLVASKRVPLAIVIIGSVTVATAVYLLGNHE